jgi:RNA polymerase sigma factor (sigma-70 family)
VTSTLELGVWWKEEQPKLIGLARSYLRSGELAEDVVQNLAILCLERQQSFASREDFARWARTRVRWMCIDQLRYTVRFSHDQSIDSRASAPNQEDRLNATELVEAVNALPPRQRSVMRLTVAGATNPEIARQLGITEATVRSLQRFGRHALAELLGIRERRP